MQLTELINHPERLNRDTLYELRTMVARYPYFQTARLLLLNNLYLLHDPDFGTELRRSVIYVADRRILFRLIEGHPSIVTDEELPKDEPSIDRTLSLIDAFLENLPENRTSSPIPIEPASDYVSTYLLQADNESKDTSTGIPLIDEFLSGANEQISIDTKTGKEEQTAPDNITDNPDDEQLEERYFTETLAKIYIKQKKYSRALEIIRSLYLKYPEKNSYFADQIRFLEKLVINNNSK